MNATYNIDHLQALTHVSSLLNTTAAVGGAAAVNKPKTATTSHYDPTGQEVATISNTSYEGVTFAADGTISGGSLSHDSLHPDGTKLSSTSVGFGSNGKPASAEINVQNLDGVGDFKKVQMDMSGVTWNNSFIISTGAVKVLTLDAATGNKIHDGSLQFDKEAVVSGAITHYDPTHPGTVTGYSDVDYGGAKFLGSTIIGGQYAVKTQTPDKQLKSNSVISLSSIGRLQGIETTNLDPKSAAVTSKVKVDLSKLVFNARNEFAAGDMNYTATDTNGVVISETTVSYNNAVPALSTTLVYNNQQVQSKIVVDYTASQFNNNLQVVNSIKKVNIFSGAGALLSSTAVAYDQFGNKTQNAPAAKAAAANAQAAKPTPPKALAAFPKLPAPSDLGITAKTDETRRTDGTLEQARTTYTQNNNPVAVVVKLYGTDGSTVIKTFTLDLSGLSFNAASNTVSGALNMQTHLGETLLSSQSSIQY
ncbi:MAG: hypothetical protein INR73_13900 [Williamsia sp.]|nr:hypothetical protein [Williamsia sp.]